MIISNNLVGKMPLPADTIIRINLAWVSIEEAQKIIENSEYPIYLDFPSGRTKPPVPKMKLEDAVKLSHHANVRYFAFSNAEDLILVRDIIDSTNCEVVPKIETETGVKRMTEMEEAGIKTFMLDKEDLYTNVNCDSAKFEKLVKQARSHNVLELQGVVFN